MYGTIVHLLILMSLECLSRAEDKMKVTASCPEHQKVFGESCYESVGLQLTFFSAQAWCEQHGGGHLAFIPDEEIQHFLQRHFDSKKNMWLGVAPSALPNLQYSSSVEGPLSWLNGSQITYSNWVSRPQPGAACGHILRDSGFQWNAARDCNQKLNFICQFESGRSTVCAGHSTTLQCGSGQVLMIDGGFYGRKNIHYCRSTLSPTTATRHQCSWVDVVELLTAHCHGRQVCQIVEVVNSFGEPCPQLGSYLSVDYHCKHGLTLSVSTVAAVFHDVTIHVNWLLHLAQGNLSCKLNTGDGNVYYLPSPEGLESSVVHKYTHPRTFVVTAECTSSDIHITAQKIITIQEPITEFGIIRCRARKLSFHVTNCKVLYGEPFQTQMEVKAGTNVTYRIQRDEMLLSSVSVVRGNVPRNITVTSEMVKQLGPGCHQLTLYASNMVTFPEVSADLQMCVLEKVAGLQASVLTVSNDCPDSPDITIGVSLKQGAPVLLLFSLTGNNSSFSETRQMNTRKDIFQIKHPIQGSVQVKLRAWNVFSSSEVDVDMFASCGKDSLAELNGHNDYLLRSNKSPIKKHIRVIRSSVNLVATPSDTVASRNLSIKLSVQNPSQLTDPKNLYQWLCFDPCGCQGNVDGLIYIIKPECLPQPFQFSKYSFNVTNKSNKKEDHTESICITVTPQTDMPTWISLSCTDGCNPVQKDTDAKITMVCTGNACPQVVWNIEDPGDNENLPNNVMKCYKSAKQKPLTKTQNGGTEYSVSSYSLAQAKGEDVTVVITSGDVVPLYRKYIIKTSSREIPTPATQKPAATVTAAGGGYTKTTTTAAAITASIGDLMATVDNAVDQLKQNGSLSGSNVGQIFNSVSSNLNSQSDQSNTADRQKLRELMLVIMTEAVKEIPPNTPEEVQVIARALIGVVQGGTELSSSAKEEAALMFENLSSSLLHMNVNYSGESKKEIYIAASAIVEGASNILNYSSNKNISDALVVVLNNVQNALLLTYQDANEGPTVILQAHIAVFVNRVTMESVHTASINIPNCSCAAFSLPMLPSNTFPSDEPVDIRMLSLDQNLFSWNEKGNISGIIGSLSLTTKDGSGIPVENLSEDIEILLPRPVGEQVNTSVLDLGNYSTTVIDLPSADTTLVLKMVPSNDPLPFKLFLGYMDYPTETNYAAMTDMPQQGTTQDERYTWLLDPKTLKGNTGVYYLVVRPIVGPGIKSINANLSITSITALCQFWNESIMDWSNKGCRVGVQTTHLVTQCLCNHLTVFGSSFFVTPNLVDPSQTAELFGTFTKNPVVVCFVGALFVAYLLVVVWARRKDIQDIAKVKVTVLEDNHPMDEYRYLLSVSTGHRRGASTSSQVTITLLGAEGNSEPHHLTDPKKCVFERGAVDMFLLTTPFSLGDLQGIRLWHNNSGSHPAWYVGHVVVQDLQMEQKWHFLCNSWLAIDMGNCSLDTIFPASTEMDLKRFSNLFFMKTTKDFSDRHIWYSVINRPPSSTFTCVQRVSCCFSLLLCTMLTSIMFYGIPTDPSEQTMDLGNFKFTWQQFMIGVQSSLIMFPVNILIVSVFRFTPPRKMSCCKSKTAKPVALEQTSFSQTATTNMNVNVTLDSVIKDITRIANSVSTVKSSISCTEFTFAPGKQVDISAVLSVVEDFIKQNNKTSDTAQSKNRRFHNLAQPQLPEGSASMHSGSTAEGIQKESNKTQYLYQQLCHIDKELSLLGPTSFTSPHSYSQALQQVQGMKGILEDQLFRSKLSPADSTDGDGSQKKRGFCHGGLPWWFIFVGWLLVIATSVIAGYFIMLYGLKFGKERSISWLISMIVSFFQSILVIQPLKVLCIAAFFALILKKVDEDDVQNLVFEGDCKDQKTARQYSSLYEPPPPADIEKMKKNKILEQKAFALFREIMIYMGFLSMLLLLAYGQRDPNAFYLNQYIQGSFSGGIKESMSLRDVFTWANTSLLSNLFGVHPGFITDGNSKLVGNARLRQLRVQQNSCQIAGYMLHFVPECNALYSWEVEDMGSYDPGWNHSVKDNISTFTASPWKYQTQDQLRAYPVWGQTVLYRGGGFVAELGPDSQNARSTLDYLFNNKWLDMYTRAIFVEFTVYNANVNLFCIVTLLLETTAIGAFKFSNELQSVRLYQPQGSLHFVVMAAEVIYLLFILYFMFLQAKFMKQQRWAYFRNKWHLLELTIILLSWSAVAVFIKRTLVGNRDMTYYQNHKDKFVSFYETATAESMLQYLIALLVLLATIKLWHLLRLNPKMYLMTAALQRAWSDISSFLVIIMIMFIAYSTACNVIYGWQLYSYKTFMDALLTLIGLQIGIFNYEEVLDSNPLLGGLLIGSCIVFMTFLVLNLLIAVILVAFTQEQIDHKHSDEEKIVDLMLNKICSLLGIRCKNTKDTVGPDANEGNGLTLNNSRNILSKSSMDVNIF